MRIVEIRDIAVPMGAPMRNAVIDFSKMTVSAVAVVTDVVRGGEPVVGFGFNANGRYAQSAVIRERLAPRVLEAPESHATADGSTLDPRAIRRLMMRNEKPGGHGERAVAVAALEIAVWDAAAKIRDMPLWAMIAEDAGNSACRSGTSRSMPPAAITTPIRARTASSPRCGAIWARATRRSR